MSPPDRTAPHLRLTTVAGPDGSPVGDWLSRPVHRRSSWPAVVRPFDEVVVAVSGVADSVGSPPLPAGAATAEASAVRARRGGARLTWTAPRAVVDSHELIAICRQRGQDSVAVARADPSLLTELQLGSWTEAGWRTRLLRRVMTHPATARLGARVTAHGSAGAVGLAADLAFWSGVRSVAGRREWRQWTRSYVVLSYHRISDDHKPDQELIDVAPASFVRQLRLLRRIGYRPMTAAELEAVHHDGAPLPARRFVVTADDGFLDCTEPLRTARVHAELFVPTADVGGIADSRWYREHGTPGWAVDDEPLADWDRLRAIESDGVAVGGHARTHTALPDLTPDELHAQLTGSREDLARELRQPIAAMAYPHGLHNRMVRDAAMAAGFRLAYTTQFGRNGAGTDAWCLRRVPVFRDDGSAAFVWKVLTGEPPPWFSIAGKARAARNLGRRPSRTALEQTARGRRFVARWVGMDERRVLEVVDALSRAGVDACLAGGWGVDALAGRRTRPHGDLDLVVSADTSEDAVGAALRPLGFELRQQTAAEGVAFSVRWVWRSRAGRAVDVIPVGGQPPFDEAGRAQGRIAGRTVSCLSPAAQRAARSGYEWRPEDHEAMRLLDSDPAL
jgi:peptidoglycan/xylan/chitin deacetylase (PgdA/CDA1 family)